MKLILVGFGNVGQGFVEILQQQAEALNTRYNFTPQLVGIATRTRGSLYHPAGLLPSHLLHAIQQGHLSHYPTLAQQTDVAIDWDPLRIIRDGEADVLIEATVTDLETGQPALWHVQAAFDTGKDVVLANKGPLVLAYAELQAAAQQAGRRLRYEATVMAGTPSITLAQEALAGSKIQRARGILNGTTNFMLTQMEAGATYDAALAQAQALGYAEADPSADVDGWDAASKVIILGALLFGARWTMADLAVQGIRAITLDDIKTARAAGERYKLVADVTPQGGQVGPQRLPVSDPLANVTGATNAITYASDLLGDVTLIGTGAGRIETGFALLSDLLALHRQRKHES